MSNRRSSLFILNIVVSFQKFLKVVCFTWGLEFQVVRHSQLRGDENKNALNDPSEALMIKCNELKETLS